MIQHERREISFPKSGSFHLQEVELPIGTWSQALLTTGASTSLLCFSYKRNILGPRCVLLYVVFIASSSLL